MLTTSRRQARLRHLMKTHGLTPEHVGKLLFRNTSYVRSWHAGINPVPEDMLRLLELEIRVGERIERVQMDTVAAEA
jgi:hypothetical protein